MSTHHNGPEIPIRDTPENRYPNIRAIATRLLLDAENGFSREPVGESMADRRADYVLDGNRTGRSAAFYLGVKLDPDGVQMAMLPLDAGDADSLVCVDLFSIPLKAGSLRLEGVESEASSDEVDKLLDIAQHSGLEELVTDAQLLQYAAISKIVIMRSVVVRSEAKQSFLARKSEEIARIAKDGYV